MADLISLPHYQQSVEGYCLSACARMMLAYLGVEMTEVEVSRVLGAQRFGTPSFAVQRLAALNLKVTYRSAARTKLRGVVGVVTLTSMNTARHRPMQTNLTRQAAKNQAPKLKTPIFKASGSIARPLQALSDRPP